MHLYVGRRRKGVVCVFAGSKYDKEGNVQILQAERWPLSYREAESIQLQI